MYQKRHGKKLDLFGKKVIFIGYSPNSKGHKFYDPSSKKVIINRDAIFNEQLMGGAWSTEDVEDNESLLSAFPFLFDNDSTFDVINTTRSSAGITATPSAE